MKRRSFFKSLVAGIVASSMDVMGWVEPILRVKERIKMAIVNPAYHNAKYEDIVIFSSNFKEMLNGMEPPKSRVRRDTPNGPAIPRFILVDSPLNETQQELRQPTKEHPQTSNK